MAEHYYSEKPNTESQPITWQTTLRGETLTFTSDNGVFSKGSVDFGSKLLVESFEVPGIDGPILDVGCGYGPIGLSVGKAFPERQITMVDINERAVLLAKQNAAANSVSATIFESNLFSKVEGKFSAILTNPPIRAGKKVVHEIFEEAHRFLLQGGQLWVVIQKKQGAPSAIEKLNTLFATVDIHLRKKGYFILRATKS